MKNWPWRSAHEKPFINFASCCWIDETGGGKIKDDSNPRVSVGFGVQWKSPFGPVRLDFAHAVMKEDYDRTQFFKFNFGANF